MTSDEFMALDDQNTVILDVRRDNDYEASTEVVPGSTWKDPSKMDDWVNTVSKEDPVVVYCVRGGGVSNSVVDRLQSEGIKARFIEGGIEALKTAGAALSSK
jgi:rhodanese-related sulfurtransferase